MRFSLIALYLLPLIVISGSTYNHHYSTDRQYSSSPGEMCKLTITKPNGEYKEALVDCNLISSFIWDAATKPNDQHVKNTTKVTVNSNGNSLVNSRPEALRLSTFPPIFSNTNSAKVLHNFNKHHHILKNHSKPYYMDLHEFASSTNLRHKDQHDMKSGSNSDNELRNENNRSASGLAGNGNRRLAGWPQAPEFTLKNGSKPYYMDLHQLVSSANLRHKDQHNAKSRSNSDSEPQIENNSSGLAGNGNRRLTGWPADQQEFTLKNGSQPYYLSVHELASSTNLRHKDQHNAKSGSNSDNESQNENKSSGLARNANRRRRLTGWPADQQEFTLKNGSKPYYMSVHALASSTNLRHKDQHNAKGGSNSDNESQTEKYKSDLAGNGNRRLAGWPQPPEFTLKNGSKPYYMDLNELASNANQRHKGQHNAKSGSNSDSEPQNKNNSSGLAGNANRRLVGWPQARQHKFILRHKDQHNAKSGSNSDNGPQNENNSSDLAGSANRLLVGRSQAHQHKFILRHKDQHNAKSGSNSDNELRNENKKSGLAGNANRRLARRLQAPEFNLKNGSKPYYMDLYELASRANLRHKDQHNAKSRSNSDSEPQNENNSSGLAGSANHRLAGWPQTHELTFKNGSKPYYMDIHEVALKNGIKNYK